MEILTRDFYDRDTLTVARELLGCYLVREWEGKKLAVRITETEAYIGRMDKACTPISISALPGRRPSSPSRVSPTSISSTACTTASTLSPSGRGSPAACSSGGLSRLTIRIA